MENRVVISAEGISIGYPKSKRQGRSCLYDNLSFQLYSGELVCLLGANGAGKSTLLRTISTSQSSLSGSIFLYDKEISNYKEKDLSQTLGLVLTDKTSVGGLTVRELVELGRYPYTGFFGQLSAEDKNIVEKAMADVCIIHKADAYVAELSDGERQKAMIAKVLAQECPIILLDEPTAFLDVASRIEITNLLHNLASKQNKTILLSTHDIELAILLADRLWLLSRQDGLQAGITEDIILNGKLDNLFDKESIVFDRISGSFLPSQQKANKVYLNAADDIFHYIKNLLARYNYQAINNKQDCLFYVKVHSINNIEIVKNDRITSLASLAEFVKWLRDNPSN